MSSISRFIKAMVQNRLPIKEQVVGVIWQASLDGEFDTGLGLDDLCKILEQAGHAKQNKSRLREQLEADRRIVKRGVGFAVSARHEAQVAKAFENFGNRRVVKASDSVLPRELFDSTRGYIEKVVAQINASYDHGLYDCCAVMCRRLGETLIIEVYEQQNRADEIKNADGNFHMLNGLLSALSGDKRINIGRNSKRGLDELKELGDKSAHNRRFNARQPDIDAIRAGLRTACEELLHIAKLIQ